MAQESLYDYVSGQLDLDRKTAFETYLHSSSELQSELNMMLAAEKYTLHLAKTRIAPVVLDQMQEVRSITEVVFLKLKWKNWPDFMKWATEAFLISVFIASAIIIIPWGKIQFHQSSKDTKRDAKSTTIATPTTEPATQAVTQPTASAPIAAVTTKSALVESVTATNMTDEGATETTSGEDRTLKKMKGLLYRILLDTEDSDSHTVALREKIISLGGKKAGQVELGWRKRDPDGNYYHFTMPESNYQKLITTLGGYGPVRIFKNPHERVMPEGQIRIILWIEDKVSEKPDL